MSAGNDSTENRLARPVAIEDQGCAAAAEIDLRESLLNSLMPLGVDWRANGQQHQIGCRNTKLLAKPPVLAGLASKFDLAGAIGNDREVRDPVRPGEIDVAVVLRVEDKMIELAQDVRKLPEIFLERGLVETRETARNENLPRLDLVHHWPERIETPLLRGLDQNRVAVEVGEELAVSIDLAANAGDKVSGDVERMDPDAIVNVRSCDQDGRASPH